MLFPRCIRRFAKALALFVVALFADAAFSGSGASASIATGRPSIYRPSFVNLQRDPWTEQMNAFATQKRFAEEPVAANGFAPLFDRNMAVARLNFRASKRFVPYWSGIEGAPVAPMEQPIESAEATADTEKRSVATGRIGFRPARSIATGRTGFRPA